MPVPSLRKIPMVLSIQLKQLQGSGLPLHYYYVRLLSTGQNVLCPVMVMSAGTVTPLTLSPSRLAKTLPASILLAEKKCVEIFYNIVVPSLISIKCFLTIVKEVA